MRKILTKVKNSIQYRTHFNRIAYAERLTLANHTNFVSSVCVLEGGEWICTGSNDATICIYIAGNIEPFTILKSHTSTGLPDI